MGCLIQLWLTIMLRASPLWSWEPWEPINMFVDAKHKSLAHKNWEMMIYSWGDEGCSSARCARLDSLDCGRVSFQYTDQNLKVLWCLPENMIKITCTAGCSSQNMMAVASRWWYVSCTLKDSNKSLRGSPDGDWMSSQWQDSDMVRWIRVWLAWR